MTAAGTTPPDRPDTPASEAGGLTVTLSAAGTPGAGLRLAGRLGPSTVGLLAGLGPAVAGSGQREFTVDVSGVTSCDTTGLWALIGLHQRLQPAGVRVVLVGVSGELRGFAGRTALSALAPDSTG
ncbi:STAS domain-containing protein [Streptomyces sp. NPDC059918]|uniref:STAS domain-containing protein n=1 Tax=unclassified Streptomyces TaxID=2593676 RepID=UPI0036625DF0